MPPSQTPSHHWSADAMDGTMRDDPFAHRQRSIRQANSRLDSYQLESALQSDLSFHHEKTQPSILLSDVSASVARGIASPLEKHKTYNYECDPFENSPVEAWQEMKNYNLRTHGFPTLDQMLCRPTPAPLTQSLFTAFLRRLGAHHNVEFLAELDQHDKLWQAYQKSSERNSRATPERHTPQHTPSHALTLSPPAHISSFTDTADTLDLLRPLSSPRQRALPDDDDTSFYVQHYHYASRTPHDPLSRDDLVRNAKKIHRTYCSPVAACGIHLPDDHRHVLEALVEQHEQPEPVVFRDAHDHVMACLDAYYYPRFLDTVLYTNTCSATHRLLLGLGVLILTVAFALEFALIFLGSGSLGTRWAVFPVFLLGWSALLASFSRFAWWLALVNKTETQFMVYERIVHKTVKKLHRKQALLWFCVTLFISFISTILFVFIPFHKLQAP